MKKRKKEKTNRKIKAIALTQIFSLVLEIFAISFIFAMSFGVVSADTSYNTAWNSATYANNKDFAKWVNDLYNNNQLTQQEYNSIASGGFLGFGQKTGDYAYTLVQSNINLANNQNILSSNIISNEVYTVGTTGNEYIFDSSRNLEQVRPWYLGGNKVIPLTSNEYDRIVTDINRQANAVQAASLSTQNQPTSADTSVNSMSDSDLMNQYSQSNNVEDAVNANANAQDTIADTATNANPDFPSASEQEVTDARAFESEAYASGEAENTITAMPGASSNTGFGNDESTASGEAENTPTDKGIGTKTVVGGSVMANVGWFQALGWAGAVVGITSALGSFLGEEKGKNVQMAGFAIGAGIMTAKLSYSLINYFHPESFKVPYWSGKSFALSPSALSIGIGFLAAFLIFANNYKDVETKEVSIEFKCYAWQAPRGGADCNKCNTDVLRPCSEYRCRALGQTCKIINAGTGMAKCIDSAPGRVISPGIKPWKEALTLGYKYTDVQERPPGGKTPGHMKIVDSQTNGCLKAFTAFNFGVLTTNKNSDGTTLEAPAQCKIEYNHTANFDAMNYYMGEQNLYIENHSQAISLPGTDAINSTFPGVVNDGEYTLYIRCKDGNGNTNEDEFAVRFCIDKSPDVTPPTIKATLPIAGSPVLYKVDSLTTSVYTNEPAKCRWSRTDASYSNMENQMSCTNNVWEMNAELLYTCTTKLTGIKDKEQNDFYFRCQDLSVRNNTMQESYKYSLIGTQPLTILSVAPNGTLGSSTSTATITLQVNTDNGYKSGESTCYYSPTSNENDYIAMAETGSNIHKQNLDLTNGNYKYYFKCVDAGGNSAYNSTEFTVFVDKFAPNIVRAYNWEGKLVITTDEESACYYSTQSCNFDISKQEGINMPYDFDASKGHIAEWKTDQNYFIKCVDKYNNQPDPSECTMMIRPYQMPTE